MDETVDLDALALATAGLVGSDLANMINEAAINAVKNGRKFVNQSDLFEAFELVAVGGKEKKDRVMSDKERKIVSYHEVGHALVSALQKNTEPVQKITIVPRTMGALGYTLQRNQRCSKRYRECNQDRACHGHHVRYVRYVWHDVSCYGGKPVSGWKSRSDLRRRHGRTD